MVKTLAMSIIFNVTPLWKVLTENHTSPGAVQLENRGAKKKNQSQSIVSGVHELQTEVAALQLLCVVV